MDIRALFVQCATGEPISLRIYEVRNLRVIIFKQTLKESYNVEVALHGSVSSLQEKIPRTKLLIVVISKDVFENLEVIDGNTISYSSDL